MEHDEGGNHAGHGHGKAQAGHGHGHGHGDPTATPASAFAIGIGLNLTFVVVEVVYGLLAHSMALVADAGHRARASPMMRASSGSSGGAGS
ncbi:MAG: hypothetical protein WDO69_30895 [Pseudomonadota bacterium]